MKSNLGEEARERLEQQGVESCPYHLANKTDSLSERLEEIKARYPDQVKKIVAEERVMIDNLVLMHGFYGPLDEFLSTREETTIDIVGQLKTRVNPDQLGFGLRIMTSRAIFAQTANWARKKIQPFDDVSENPKVNEFIDFLVNYLEEKEVKDPRWWRQTFNNAYALLREDHPEIYEDPVLIQEIYWRFLREAYKADVKDGVLSDDDFQDYETLSSRFGLLMPQEEDEAICKTRFLHLLNVPMGAYPAVIGSVSSMIEEFAEQEGYESLSATDKIKMINSFRSELIVMASKWSRQFIDQSSKSNLDSAVFFMPESFAFKPGVLLYDFDNLRIFIDGSKYTKERLASEEFPIQRGCPVTWVKQKEVSGSFLTRQIDLMMKIFAKHYLEIDIT